MKKIVIWVFSIFLIAIVLFVGTVQVVKFVKASYELGEDLVDFKLVDDDLYFSKKGDTYHIPMTLEAFKANPEQNFDSNAHARDYLSYIDNFPKVVDQTFLSTWTQVEPDKRYDFFSTICYVNPEYPNIRICDKIYNVSADIDAMEYQIKDVMDTISFAKYDLETGKMMCANYRIAQNRTAEYLYETKIETDSPNWYDNEMYSAVYHQTFVENFDGYRIYKGITSRSDLSRSSLPDDNDYNYSVFYDQDSVPGVLSISDSNSYYLTFDEKGNLTEISDFVNVFKLSDPVWRNKITGKKVFILRKKD